MQTYELTVQNRAVNANSKDTTLVRTSVGIDQIHVLFDNEEWLGFPITVTFAQGSELITRSLVVSAVDSSDWVCEATVPIPWEVIDTNGPIRITFQGTDSNGNHIITAKGSPLKVEEAGDVTMGEVPSDAPTIDQWQEAYAQALAAANDARSAAQALSTQADQIIEALQAQLQEYIDSVPEYQLPMATSETLGGIKVGGGLEIQEDGTLSASETNGMTVAQSNALTNLSMLAYYCFDTEFDEDTGLLKDNASLKVSKLPRAAVNALGISRPDGTTITINESGVISAGQYELPQATSTVLGGVRVDGQTILANSGVISAKTATTSAVGMVKPDGTTITISQDGTITASGSGEGGYILPMASDSQLGGIRVDGTSIGIDENGVIGIVLQNAAEVDF